MNENMRSSDLKFNFSTLFEICIGFSACELLLIFCLSDFVYLQKEKRNIVHQLKTFHLFHPMAFVKIHVVITVVLTRYYMLLIQCNLDVK